MIRTMRKAYRIACIAFGRRKVRSAILIAFLGMLAIAYQNQFELSGMIADITQFLKQWSIGNALS